MRLRRLVIQGFMPFREEQQVDFSGHDIFALIGPTGSGKSAVLDAVCFALYARAPRWQNARPAQELVTTGYDNMKVELEFEVSRQRYRVVRTVRLRKKSPPVHEAELRKEVDGVWKPPSGERLTQSGTTEEIARVVGMNYDTFTRTLLLPQGQFDRLLKPDHPKDRKKLLIELAGLNIYDRMYEVARDRCHGFEREVEKKEAALEQFREATPELRSQLETELQALTEKTEALNLQVDRVSRELQSASDQLALQQRLEVAEENLQQLKVREHEMSARSARLELARRVAEEAATLTSIDQLRRKLEGQSKLVDECVQHLLEQRACLEKAERRLELAEKEQAMVPDLESDLEKLREAAALWERLSEHRTERADAEKALAASLEQKERMEGDISRRGEERNQLLEDLAKNEVEQAALPGLEDAAQRLAESRLLVEQLQDVKNDLETCDQQVERARDQLQECVDSLARARNSLETLQQEREQALERSEQANQRYRHFQAHQLRGELRVGEACPVCRQSVEELPACPEGSEEEEAGALVTQAREELERITSQLHQADLEHHGSQQAFEAAESELTRWQKERARSAGRREKLVDQILPLTCWSKLPADPAQALAEEVEEMEQKRARMSQLQERKQALQTELQTVKEQLHRAEGKLSGLAEEVAQARSRLDKATTREQERERELKAVLPEPLDGKTATQELESWLGQERERRQNQVHTLNTELREAGEACQAVRTKVRVAEATRAERVQHLESLKQDLGQAESHLEQVLSRLDLDSESALREALLGEAELEALAGEVEEYRQTLDSARNKVRELAAEVEGRPLVTASEVQELKETLSSDQALLSGSLQSQGELRARRDRVVLDLERAGGLNEELKDVRERHRTYKTLTGMLDARGLKAFVANRLMDRILVLASSELYRLSDRYRLVLSGHDIYVQDEWNAGALRDVKSLSGGETFLASLSLALALVEYLSEGSPLESLFIDEGFGTLDAETLEVVAQTLESLQEKGRLVGVITHVVDLAERLPAQIRVRKQQSGSEILEEETG